MSDVLEDTRLRDSVIERLGAENATNKLMEAVRVALANKKVFADAQPGEQVPSHDQVSARREKIRGDIESALRYYKEGHEEMLIGDENRGAQMGNSIQSIVNNYTDALIGEDKDPNKRVGIQYLGRIIHTASSGTRQGVSDEIERITREAAVSRTREETATTAHAAGREAERAARGPMARFGEKVDKRAQQVRSGDPIDRRRMLAMALGIPLAGAAAVGGGALIQKGCGKPTPTPAAVSTEPPLPINFRKVVTNQGKPDQSVAILTERDGNQLVFSGKDTSLIKDGQETFFNKNGATEIHITDPAQHSGSITIDTPEYTRGSRSESSRPKVDLCFHPSVLASYTVTANSNDNGNGETTKDLVLSFDPRPGATTNQPFRIVIKGHGVDAGGVYKDGKRDQSGLDQIKLVDSCGQVIKEVDVSRLSTAREFKNTINALQFDALRSIDVSTPLSTIPSGGLAQYAAKRFQDISDSHGQGKGRTGP